jgi:molybdate transport system permease protein
LELALNSLSFPYSKNTDISTKRSSGIRFHFNNTISLFSIPLILFIALPIVALFVKTPFGDIFANLDQYQLTQSIKLSLITSLSTTLLTLVVGTPVALLLAQRNFRLYRLVDTLIDLPTVLPPSVAGIALLMAFGRRGIFGSILQSAGITIPFPAIAVIMAQMFIASPLYIKAATIGFSSVENELVQAASLDGANKWQIFRYITLPISWSSVMSGSVMTWARSLGEFGATIIFAGNFPGRTQTMPLAIYIGFEIDLNVALTLAVILICFSFLTLIIVKGILHQKFQGMLPSAADVSF